MNRNVINDPKVGFELGEGGAPTHITGRIRILVEVYNATRLLLSTVGFNLLDKSRKVEETKLPEDEEEKIRYII
jgi:hypothetical protein